ncbi:MAG: coproporphyrinogen III oxidase family protein [Muribaculaceae bacterium]|nr:coproporphyrinogen III oxidase family protein [Muribaculaceae bacterium]
MTEVEEFTLEVNPDDVNVRMLEIWKRGGVNRLSIGIQTFDDSSLKALGRRHDGTDALQAYRLARKFFDNISVDLMFGLPGQTLDVWYRDLQIALELRPEHISAYSLMYEEGTVLTALRDSGRLEEISEEMSEMMFRLLMEKLAKAGYDHYEISNFALPGYRSHHNTSYWLQKPYIGLGPSAHSYDGERKRKANRAALRSYLDRWTPCDGIVVNEEDVMEIENLCEEELMEEYILTRTRMREGIPLEHFAGLFGMQALDRLLVNAAPLVNEGKVLLTDSHISLSEDAIMLSDSLILRLVESLC